MKKIYLLLILLIIGIAKNYSQSWQWKDSTLDSKILKDTNDDLYIFSNNSPNFTIKKLDVNGTILWTKTAIGNAVITAYKIDGNNNLVLLGNITSSTTYGAFTLIPKGQQSFFILKLSPNSSVLSANVYGSPRKTFANDIFINANGDYLIGGGFTGTFDINGYSIIGDTLQNFFIVKTDMNQNVLWFEKSTWVTTTYGDEISQVDELVETASGKIYATITFLYGLIEYNGYQFTSNDGQFLIQLDNSRNITWTSYIDYPPISYDYMSDIQTKGDTVYMKDFARSNHSSWSNIYMWNDSGIKTTNYINSTDRLGYAVANGKIYYAFKACDTVCYAKVGTLTLGLSAQGQTADSAVMAYGIYSEVQYISPTSLYIGGREGGIMAPFAGKFTMSAVTSVAENNNKSDQFQIFPNPTAGIFTISSSEFSDRGSEVKIYNPLGEKVFQKTVSRKQETLNLSPQSKGIYFIEIISDGKRETRKIVLN